MSDTTSQIRGTLRGPARVCATRRGLQARGGQTSGGQLEVWTCPTCMTPYTVEMLGVIRTRHHGVRRLARFQEQSRGLVVTRCVGCGGHLHWLYNDQGANGCPLSPKAAALPPRNASTPPPSPPPPPNSSPPPPPPPAPHNRQLT